jgi:MFS family permease
MGLSTVAIGCLPTYNAIGIAAPILLTIFRLLQGIAVGGDLPGGLTFVSEHADRQNRGINCAIVFCGVNIGLLLASGVGTLITSLLTQEQVFNWGWRLAFWFSAVLIVIGLYLRLGLQESNLFLAAQKNQLLVKNPLHKLLHQEFFPQTVIGLGLVWLFSVIIMQVFTKLPSFLHENSAIIALNQAMLLNTLSLAIFAALIPLMGWVSDRVGRKKCCLSQVCFG